MKSGTTLGPYQIVAAIGSGGMGEVYRARDPRLGRDVAIKVLPAAFSAEPDRLRRFEQEARAVAALNHPNILALYDLGTHDGQPYVVSELLEGQTLRDALEGGALPIKKAIDYAVQIANGLAAAHERGIVHRDLKPENLFITHDGRVKILDFGLAKVTEAQPAFTGVSASPTTPPAGTQPGLVLGTAGYMSPEQVRGLPADHRADLFAFGAVLYEMLSGRRAFRGDTTADTMTAILKEAPSDLADAQRPIPPALVRIVDRCLEKMPAARFQSAGDLAFALAGLATQSESVAALPTRIARPYARSAWILSAIVAITSIVAGTMTIHLWGQRGAQDARPFRTSILLPAGVDVNVGLPPAQRLALSPDGRRLAFAAVARDGRVQLWVRSLDELVAQPLVGTDDAALPCWSPDGRFVAFFAQGKLKTINASGGPVLTLTDAAPGLSFAWNRDDVILFSAPGSFVLHRISASGGPSTAVTTLDAARGDRYHSAHGFLPDGRHFLYVVSRSQADRLEYPLYVGSLDPQEKSMVLLESGSNAKYAEGYLVFLRDTTLMAQPFDAKRLVLSGDARPIAEHVAIGGATGRFGAFTVSDTGVLAYQAGGDVRSQLTWFDRNGKTIGKLGDPGDYAFLELSPDGTRAAIGVLESSGKNRDLWLYDVARGLRTQFTFDPGDKSYPIWSPDGSQIVFASRRSHFDLYRKPSSGAGQEEVLLADGLNKLPFSWSPDGRYVSYASLAPTTPRTGADLWMLPLAGDRKPSSFLQTPFNESAGRFSPDGRWLAYTSNESEQTEVYVASFPGPGGKWRVSTGGGNWPRWRKDGREIFFLTPNNTLMAAAVNGQGSSFEVGVVHALFETHPRFENYLGSASGYSYDVSVDGQRVLVNTRVGDATSTPITLVINWAALLKP